MEEDRATAQLYPPFLPAEGTTVLSSQIKLMEPSLGVPGFLGCTPCVGQTMAFPSPFLPRHRWFPEPLRKGKEPQAEAHQGEKENQTEGNNPRARQPATLPAGPPEAGSAGTPSQ